MSVDAVGARPVVVIAGYGFTADELAAAAPPRLRPTVGTDPYAGWARLDELVLAVHPTSHRTEVAQVKGRSGMPAGTVTVAFADLTWTSILADQIVAPLPEAHR